MDTARLPKEPLTLALFAVQSSDYATLNRLLLGLQFHEPIRLTWSATSNADALKADIVVVDMDQIEGRNFIKNAQPAGKVVCFGEQLQTPSSLYLNKPFRARELINCINSIIDTLH